MISREIYGCAILLGEDAMTSLHLYAIQIPIPIVFISFCVFLKKKLKALGFSLQWLAIDTLKEVEAFLSGNPSEIVTLFLEDYVETPNGLSKVFKDAGLMKYWFPVSSMPQNGRDWPLVKDMVASNQRFVVFTSAKSKQESEGIAYQWNYVVENHCTTTFSLKR